MNTVFKKYGKLTITILILFGILFYYNGRKQGFHEDEMFSYGSSNYKYDNVYRNYGYAQSNNDYLFNHVLTGSLYNKATGFIDFLLHQDEKKDEFDETLKKEIPIFKTKEDAKEYLTIGKNDVFNFASVWYNQLCDVHPPMFYNMLHIYSTLFYGNFTKYIGFFLNLTFFLITILTLYKIMLLLKKDKLAIPTIILYGASMGAISTTNFHRMYMMLTAFTTIYLYFALKYSKKKYQITKKDKITWSITIFLGFLTQYYFCIYIVLIFLILGISLIKNKNWQNLKELFLIHSIPAIIGIILFPASIEDIFFSYRGLGATKDHTMSYLSFLFYYIKSILKSFSIPYIIAIILGISFLLKVFLKKDKTKKLKNKETYLILFLPIPLFIMIISKLAPFLGNDFTTRYIYLLLPCISIGIIWILNYIFPFKNSHNLILCLTIFLSIFGTIIQKPTYLYERYKEALEIAEQNQDKPFIYIYDNYFTHLSSMKEFLTYQKSLIINYQIYDFAALKEKEELKETEEIIVCIKNWLDVENLLNKIKENTGFKHSETLLEIKEDINSTYYKLSKI